MNVEKVYLVNAGNDDSIAGIANDGTFPALGVLSLATAIKEKMPDLEIIVDDGQVTSKESIEQKILREKPDVLGVSVLGTSYKNALWYAEIAKQIGAEIIFGNDQPAIFGENILNARRHVDYISRADIGEIAFIEFIEYLKGERPVESVRKLLYRTQEGLKTNELPEIDYNKRYNRGNVLDQIPIPDRKLYGQETWKAYLENYLEKYGAFHNEGEVTGVATINRARGCVRVKDPCMYCGIADLTMRFSSPTAFWKDVRSAKEQVNATILYEAFDSFSSAPRWIRQLIQAKPADLDDVKFFVYTQAKETTNELIKLYKELGVFRVNMGLDSGDEVMLKRLKGPLDSVEKMKEQLIKYKSNNINVYGSLVLGAPGETTESLQNSIDFSKWLVDEKIVTAIEAQPLFPEINAKSGVWLFNPAEAYKAAAQHGFRINNKKLLGSMKNKWIDKENLDPDEISRDWAEIFCGATYQDILKASEQIRAYASQKNIAQGKAFF